MATKVDATSGNLVKKILIYTIPVILSSILQQCFNLADKAVLGNMAGSVAVAAIGTTGIVTNLIISAAIGITTGTIIILARYIGQQNDEKIRKTVNTSVLSALIFGVIIAGVGVISTPAFLKATGCPNECFKDAVLYARIYFASAPAILLYNYGSAILRTLGDTQRPLIYIIIAGVVNVTLNVILCLVLPNKVLAVAIATVTSQAISAALVVLRLCRFEGSARLCIRELAFSFSTFLQMMRFGIPAAITSVMTPLANLQVVPAINSYGVDAIAGNSTATSIQEIAMSFNSGFSAAASTFVGQNLGAGNVERVKKSIWYLLGLTILISGSVGVIFYLCGRFSLGIILGFSAKTAIEYGMQRMFFVTLFNFIAAINGVLSHSLQAFGYPLFTSISHIAFTLGFRTIWMQLVYPLNQVFSMVMLCFTVSWTLNMLLYIIFFSFVYYRYVKYGKCKVI